MMHSKRAKAAMSLDELDQLSPQEYDKAIACRVAAREAGSDVITIAETELIRLSVMAVCNR